MTEPRIIIPPPCEPLSLSDAKKQLRLDDDFIVDDDLVRSSIAAARTHIENVARRQLVMATKRATMDQFPGAGKWGGGFYSGGGGGGYGLGAAQARPNAHLDDAAIVLYQGPLQSVLAIKYLDTAGAPQTLDASAYTIDAEDDPARIMPVTAPPAPPAADAWPDALEQVNAVSITYASGYMTPFTIDDDGDGITLAAGARELEEGQAVQLVAIDGDLPDGLAVRTNYFALNVAGLQCALATTPGGGPISLGSDFAGTLLIDALPETLRHALRMLVSFFYENRGDMAAVMPDALSTLVTPHKVWRF